MKDNIADVFIVEDEKLFGTLVYESLKGFSDDFNIRLFESGDEFVENLSAQPDMVIVDYNLPTMNGLELVKRIKKESPDTYIIVLSGQEDVNVVVEAYSNGARHYIVKNENSFIELKNCFKNLQEKIGLKKELEYWQDKILDRQKYHNIIGESASIMKVLGLIQKVEKTDIITLITGESGTGKELVANAIHYNSPRRKRPFIPVNVAAIPDDLVESELFGHEKGAFTGAVGRRIGKFEEANGGTIFLDEIGEIDNQIQTKLLRVLQEKVVTRLGSNKEIKLDIRIVAATNKKLNDRVKEGLFREDLYYRLQGFLIHLPPLRDRDNDKVIIANQFLKDFCSKNNMQGKYFDKEALKEIFNYPWPGNVRELKSAVERAVLISDEERIKLDDLIFSDKI